VNANAYGGYVSEGSGAAIRNTVTLSGTPTLSASVIYGEGTQAVGGTASDLFTGNTLNVLGVSALRVKGLANFQNYNFMPPLPFMSGMTMIESTDGVDLANTNVTLSGKLPGGGGNRFSPGQSIVLIDNTRNTPAHVSGLVTQGVAKTADVCGDPIKFKDMDSHRLRGGARFRYAINEYVTPYIGAAYEHEFDGRARAAVYGHKVGTPDLIGGTGMGELGLSLNPSKDLPLSIDLGVQGYVGKREGVTGSLQVHFEF